MYCSECGKKINESHKYCRKCGAENNKKSNNTDKQYFNIDIKFNTKLSFYLIIVLLIIISTSFVFSADSDNLSIGTELIGSTDPFNSDTDNDGIDDDREINSIKTDPVDPDTDNDGLKDGREVQIGTNPNNKDTDDDGLNDGEEIKHNTDPLQKDTDNDGLNDGEEIKHNTDPLQKDTDNDELLDGVEVNKYDTDPLQKDTDNDNLNDHRETLIRTDPTNPDTDDDGLNDGREIQFNTLPKNPDSDDDGLEDGKEIEIGTNPNIKDTDDDNLNDSREVNIGSNPLVKDSDDDELNDSVEVKIYSTNPTKKDTDGDDLNDKKEINIGTDPNVWDSSGDGYSDGFLYNLEENPKKYNIIVEVQYAKDAWYPQELFNVQDKFQSAPVESDMNKKGINLILSDGGQVNHTGVTSLSAYTNSGYDKKYKTKLYHAVFVSEIKDRENMLISGVTSKRTETMLIETNNNSSYSTANTFMHELGHQVGLWPDVFQGIDSRKYTWKEYPSVMNYNRPECSWSEILFTGCPRKPLKFTDDEWDIISTSLKQENEYQG